MATRQERTRNVRENTVAEWTNRWIVLVKPHKYKYVGTHSLYTYTGWKSLSENPNVTFEILEQHIEHWNYESLSRNPCLPLNFVVKHPDKPWEWYQLSNHPMLSIDIVKSLSHKGWNWNKVSAHPNINMQNIIDNPKLGWMYFSVSSNPNLTIDILLKQHDNPWWHWPDISSNKAISNGPNFSPMVL